MGSYAPICRISRVIGDPTTAVQFLVDTGIGDAFTAAPPFTILVWPNQQLPIYDDNPYQTRNAEPMTVTAVEDDLFTVTRATSPIALQGGLMVAQIAAQPVAGAGETVHLVDTISDGMSPYTLRLARPDGTTETVTGLPGVDWEGTVGLFPLEPQGQYHYQFEDVNGKRSALQDVFVRFAGA